MGLVRISWLRTGKGALVEASVPPGAEAVLRLPEGTRWLESGKRPGNVSGLIEMKQGSYGLVLRLGSGNYRFSTTLLQMPAAAVK
jgi:hypothetical protein